MKAVMLGVAIVLGTLLLGGRVPVARNASKWRRHA